MARRTRLWPWAVAAVLALALAVSSLSHEEPLPRDAPAAAHR